MIGTRVTDRERNLVEAAAKLERASLAETVRKYTVAGAVDRLRSVDPEDDGSEE